MSFKKITSFNADIFYDIGEDSIKVVAPGVGAVEFTTDSFVGLLDYLRSYEFIMARQNIGNSYYKKDQKPVTYFAETADGDLILVDIVPNRSGKVGDVVFKTVAAANGREVSTFSMTNPQITALIAMAAIEGIESEAPEYAGIVKVDALPAETSAKRFAVYLNAGKYYTLNAEEDALVEITVVEKPILPSASTSAAENVLYNLSAVQEVPSPRTTFQPGVYTYAASGNTFTLQDLKIEKVGAVPDADKADAKTIYVLTKAQKIDDETTRPKGSAWQLSGETFAEETRKIQNVTKLPFVELAVADTNYLVDGVVTKFASGKFTKIGKVEAVEELPDVTTIKVDATLIYVLTQNDGERLAGTKWVFDLENKEFVSYVDPTAGPAGEAQQIVDGGDSQP